MTQITVEIPQAQEFLKALSRAPELTTRELHTALTKSAFEIERYSKEESPIKSGRLRSSISSDIRPLEAVISPRVNYAVFVHEGTQAHRIFPTAKRALFWKGASHPVRSVMHTGTKANPFMRRGLDRAEPAIDRHFDRALQNVVEFLAR